MNQKPKTRFDDMPPAQQAGILCNDDRFQRFAATRCGFPREQFSATAAAEYIRQCCKMESRRDLETNPKARARFDEVRTEFDAWIGKIPTPR